MPPRQRKTASKKHSSSSGQSSSDTPVIDPTSSLTPDNLDKERKNLAAAHGPPAVGTPVPASVAAHQRTLLMRAAVLLVLAAIAANASRDALEPAFGSVAVGRLHTPLLSVSLFVGWTASVGLQNLFPRQRNFSIFLPLIAVYIPVVQYFLAAWLADTLGARWAPIVIELVTVAPLLVGTSAVVAIEVEPVLARLEDKWKAIPGILGCYVFMMATAILRRSRLGSGGGLLRLPLLRTRIVRQVTVAAAFGLAGPSKLLLAAVPALLHAAFINVHVATPQALVSLNNALSTATSSSWSVVDRFESTTGYLSVLDNHVDGFRVLRCDHSLLGGEWTRVAVDGPVAEPIYGVFVMLEAVRLVELPEKKPDNEAKALVIGLGVGTTPSALIAHGIDTTVVEIDPAVHDFASRYFRLPSNHTAVIQDAETYAAEQAEAIDGPRFDYIVHDVFTGGAEPVFLFTADFFQNLHDLLTPTGVIAINYAGDFNLTPIKAVVHTIRSVFPSCRLFRERSAEDALEDEADFANVVIFCTRGDQPITFRPPVESDYLQTRSREMFLTLRNEVVDADFRSTEEVHVVRSDDTAQLDDGQTESALGHWSIMRKVVPPKVWELW